MAGRGSRFANAGYRDPKPLIRFGGKPMIRWVIENVRPATPHRFIFLCLAEHLRQYPDIPAALRDASPGCEIVAVEGVTEGAACTVLLARPFIDGEEPLMIANADQYVSLSIDDYLAAMEANDADGLIMTFEADDPKWSYCRLRTDGTVSEVVEKQVVSNEATVGIYNFRRGRDFVAAAEEMIARNLRVNGEFYVAPTYNQLIGRNAKIVVARTGREYDGMYGLGTPADLDFFKTTDLFEQRRLDGGSVQSQRDRVEALTHQYASFFGARNLNGVAALLADDFVLEDPAVVQLKGKALALEYIRDLFTQHPGLTFEVRNIVADQSRGVIEFCLHLGDRSFRGADVIEWSSGKMACLRAYLY